MTGIDWRAAGERLERLRRALNFNSQEQFALFLGLTKAQYNNFARGAAPISRPAMEKIMERTGIAPQWLWHGDVRFLTVDMAQKLGELPAPPPPRKPASNNPS